LGIRIRYQQSAISSQQSALFGVGWVGVGVHLGEPVEEVEDLAAFGAEEVEEVAEADVFGVEAGVGFETPLEVGAAPGAEVMTAGGGPEEVEGFEHLFGL
jgi:hypothetical protein